MNNQSAKKVMVSFNENAKLYFLFILKLYKFNDCIIQNLLKRIAHQLGSFGEEECL